MSFNAYLRYIGIYIFKVNSKIIFIQHHISIHIYILTRTVFQSNHEYPKSNEEF